MEEGYKTMKNFLKAMGKILLVLLFIAISFVFGCHIGKNHVITDSKISLVNSSVYIEIDNNTYVHNID